MHPMQHQTTILSVYLRHTSVSTYLYTYAGTYMFAYIGCGVHNVLHCRAVAYNVGLFDRQLVLNRHGSGPVELCLFELYVKRLHGNLRGPFGDYHFGIRHATLQHPLQVSEHPNADAQKINSSMAVVPSINKGFGVAAGQGTKHSRSGTWLCIDTNQEYSKTHALLICCEACGLNNYLLTYISSRVTNPILT